MSYIGKSFIIPCDRGGITFNPNVDTIPPVQMIDPSRNLNLQQMGRTPRGGTSIYRTCASGVEVKGIHDVTFKDGKQYMVVADKSGNVYTTASTTIKTGLTSDAWYSFAMFENKLHMANGKNTPQVWAGSGSMRDITSKASDWSGSNHPSQLVVHGRRNSQRLWAIMAGSHQYNNCIYGSKADSDGTRDGEDFADTTALKFEIETNDGYGIVGGTQYGDRLIVFGKRKAYVLDDDSTNETDWGYDAAQWDGGVANWRLIVKTPNDLVCMMEDGEIYSVRAAENYGDYVAASLTRPAHIHKFIQTDIDLTKIDKFHAIYDPDLRCIKFFMVRNGQQNPDTALCYFIDRDPKEAWMRHDNQTNASGYRATVSGLYRKSIGVYKVFTGDISGRVWELETANKNDNSLGYYAGFRTPAITFDNVRATKNFKRIWLSVKPSGAWNINMTWWVDGSSGETGTVSVAGGSQLDTFRLDTDTLGGLGVLDNEMDLGSNGRRVQFEVYNSTVDQDFFINQLMVDYRELGNKPR